MTIRSTLARYAPCILAVLVLMALCSAVSASDATEILDVGKKEISGMSATLATILKIVIGIGALIGIGIAIWGSVIQFNVMRLVTGLGIVIVCAVGWAVIAKIQTKVAGNETGAVVTVPAAIC